jgi:hypothetical protein
MVLTVLAESYYNTRNHEDRAIENSILEKMFDV